MNYLEIMFYVDSQRTLTRRDSSLILPKRNGTDTDYETSTQAHMSNAALTNDSWIPEVTPPKESIRKELITMMFESMLDCIVSSWETIMPPKDEEILDLRAGSDTTIMGKRKKTRKSIVLLLKQ